MYILLLNQHHAGHIQYILPHSPIKLFQPRHFLLQVSVPRQETERSCICVLEVSMLPLSTILILDFRIVLTACYILFFIFCYHWIRYGYVPLVVNGHFLIHHRFVTRLTRRVALFDQELLTLPVHLSSLPVFSEVRVTRSLVVCVCFVDRCLSFCTFSFGHFVVCSSSIYGF